MVEKRVLELIVPRCEGRAVEVGEGHTFRIIAIEGKQVGDLTLLNARDFTETLNVPVTSSTSNRSMFRAEGLYSGPPHFNEMASVTFDETEMHWLHGRCTSWMYKVKFGKENHPNCHDNIVGALGTLGVAPHEVPFDTFNVFMVAEFDQDGRYSFKAPVIDKGDYMDFRANQDLLVAVSACPSFDEINDYEAKPLKLEVWEGL